MLSDLNLILVPMETTLKYYSESCTLAAFIFHSKLSYNLHGTLSINESYSD